MNSKDIKVIRDPCTIDDLLPMFCCDPVVAGKYSIAEPWVRNGWKYATDGSVCIRAKMRGPTTIRRLVPDGEALFDKLFDRQAADWHPWPDHSEFGSGPEHIIGGRLISRRYWHLIAQLPNVMYSAGGKPNTALTFRFDKTGQGLVMPVCKSKEASL